MNTFQSKLFLLKKSLFKMWSFLWDATAVKLRFSVVCVLAYVGVTMPDRTFTSALCRKLLLQVIKFSERASAVDPITA